MARPTVEPPRLSTQAFWLIVAKIVSFGLSLVAPLVLVRLLNVFHYGLYKQVFLVVATAQTTLPLNVGLSAFYFLPRDPERRNATVFNILLFNFAVGALAFLAFCVYPRLPAILVGTPELVPYAPAMGLLILLWVFSSVLEYIATAEQQVGASAVFIITAQLAKTVFLLAGVWRFRTVEVIIYAVILQGALQSALLLWYVRKRYPGFWKSFDGAHFRRQIEYALPLGLAGLLYKVQMDAHHYFISHQFGTAAYAVYAVGCSQIPLVWMIRESVTAVLLSRFSALQSEGRHNEAIRLSAEAVRKQALVYWPIFVYLMVVGREFIVAVYTPQYEAAVEIFQINLLMIPLTLVYIADPIVRAYSEYRYVPLFVRIPSSAISLVLLALWSRQLGMRGVISLVVGIGIIERLAICWKAAEAVSFEWKHLRLFSPVALSGVAALGAGAVTLAIKSMRFSGNPIVVLALSGCVFALVYGSVIWYARLLNSEEREFARRHVRRALAMVLPPRD